MEIARVLYYFFTTKHVAKSHEIQQLVSRLMQHAEDICVMGSDVSGPSLYLLKMIVRQFGFPCLNYAFKEYEWIIPNCLRANTKVCLPTFVLMLYLKEILNLFIW